MEEDVLMEEAGASIGEDELLLLVNQGWLEPVYISETSIVLRR